MLKALLKTRVALQAFVLSLVLVVPAVQAQTVHEEPTMLAMTTDLLVVRPITFSVMVVGAVLWVPFGMLHAAAGGNFLESGKVLVARPAVTTFVRCLGCTEPGYRKE